VPQGVWQELYDRGVVIGALDVSLHELQPLAVPGAQAGSARLKYTPERPVFSIMFQSGCISWAMSDWLDVWDVADIVDWRLLDIAEAKRSSTSRVARRMRRRC
jgi:hypothetical protein